MPQSLLMMPIGIELSNDPHLNDTTRKMRIFSTKLQNTSDSLF